ncbi:MAG: sigma-70 family RNA polymerase sigma factor [Neomegalonema sp.]|nr:sigma-70 family RNA polymerase sigma factor [Neomegalonema sp.]
MTAGSRITDSSAEAPPCAGPSDEELLARIGAQRDREAFRMFYERYAQKLRAFMIRAEVNVGEAEEAAQEALIAVWRRAETFDPTRASAAAWLYTIARNRRIDLARRWARPQPDPDDPTYRPDPPKTAEASVGEARRDVAVRAAILKLSDEQQAVVRLSFFDGLSHLEIAQELGLPLGTVKSRLRLAFQRLRTELGLSFQSEIDGD